MTAENKRICPPFPENVRRFHILGICGTGMGSLAVMLKELGYQVSGSDTGFYPPMSLVLENHGISCFSGWDESHLQGLLPESDIVVVGNVCRSSNIEAIAAQEQGIASLSLPETLYHFFLKKVEKRICVTGTHGKTTTSSLIATVLDQLNLAPSFFIGGELLKYGTGAHKGDDRFFVIEGDEYDSAFFDKVPKFWHYDPNLLCINNIEFDHADIYNSLEEIEDVFKRLVESMPETATIVYNADDEKIPPLLKNAKAKIVPFALKAKAEYHAENIVYHENAGLSFEVFGNKQSIARIESKLTGQYNVYNLLAAFCTCLQIGLDPISIAAALGSFVGVRKRQELIADVKGIKIYDDFAHHPTAVRETLKAIRQKHPQAKLWAVFEIKSNTSRRAIFQNDYPAALMQADEIILSAPWRKDDLAPEKLIKIPQIVDDLNKMGKSAKLIPTVEEIVNYLALHCESGDIVLGMSGSSFDGLHHRLEKALVNTRLK